MNLNFHSHAPKSEICKNFQPQKILGYTQVELDNIINIFI